MIENVMDSIGGMSMYGVLSSCLFIAVFVGVVVWTIRLKRPYLIERSLKARLPIQFDDRAEMEVDLLDTEARLAIELDGPQHLSDPEAYRRRKDFLLQENGYLVLRFLTEDVAKRLDNVLDTLTHALAGRIRK